MSDPNSEGADTSETGDETHSLTGHEPGDVDCASRSLSTPAISAEIARQIEATTDYLTKQLDDFVT